ncbi:MAG: hypothetical protein JWN70_2143 [Planctomycetaceae bacterium]|nr:hypothetical protein [Planctomycetaceae bacterium]
MREKLRVSEIEKRAKAGRCMGDLSAELVLIWPVEKPFRGRGPEVDVYIGSKKSKGSKKSRQFRARTPVERRPGRPSYGGGFPCSMPGALCLTILGQLDQCEREFKEFKECARSCRCRVIENGA